MTLRARGPILYDRGASSRDFYRDMPAVTTEPDDYLIIYDDFIGVAHDTNGVLGTVVKDTGASVAIEADTVGGKLLLSSAATTDNDGASVQGNEIFKLAAGRKIWVEFTLQVSDADQMDVCVGLATNFATNPEALLTTADRICFQINDGGASILCKTEKDGTETSTDSGVDAADATDVTLGIRIDGTGSVEFFVNGALVATHTTNIPDDENLALAVMELSGDATGTKSLALDYVFAAMTR